MHEYQQLVYDYYSKHAVAFLTTYYNINTDQTIWEDEKLLGGSYEAIGEYSGVKFNKILLLPVYFIEELPPSSFDGQEIGLVKEGETSIVIPSSYGITPYPHDLVKFEQEYLRPSNDVYPVYTVVGAEIHPNTDKRFWKLKIEVLQSEITTEVDKQVENTLAFYDYDKIIHTLVDSEFLTKMLLKNSSLRGTLKELFDDNSGFYLI